MHQMRCWPGFYPGTFWGTHDAPPDSQISFPLLDPRCPCIVLGAESRLSAAYKGRMWLSFYAVFELHGSQSMPGPLTYFHYPIGPMLLRKAQVHWAPHLFFCNSITAFYVFILQYERNRNFTAFYYVWRKHQLSHCMIWSAVDLRPRLKVCETLV